MGPKHIPSEGMTDSYLEECQEQIKKGAMMKALNQFEMKIINDPGLMRVMVGDSQKRSLFLDILASMMNYQLDRNLAGLDQAKVYVDKAKIVLNSLSKEEQSDFHRQWAELYWQRIIDKPEATAKVSLRLVCTTHFPATFY